MYYAESAMKYHKNTQSNNTWQMCCIAGEPYLLHENVMNMNISCIGLRFNVSNRETCGVSSPTFSLFTEYGSLSVLFRLCCCRWKIAAMTFSFFVLFCVFSEHIFHTTPEHSFQCFIQFFQHLFIPICRWSTVLLYTTNLIMWYASEVSTIPYESCCITTIQSIGKSDSFFVFSIIQCACERIDPARITAIDTS